MRFLPLECSGGIKEMTLTLLGLDAKLVIPFCHGCAECLICLSGTWTLTEV